MEKNIVKAFLRLKAALNCQAWLIESAFVLTVLLATAIASGKGWVEYLAVCAVYFTFKHASVSERLREANDENTKSQTAETTSCAHKLMKFFYAKEVLWVAYFLLVGAYSALAGCGIFLLYGWWRKAYRKHHPRTPSRAKDMNFIFSGKKFYRHFKHLHRTNTDLEGCYEVIGRAENTEAQETFDKVSVIYRPLYKFPNMEETGFLSRQKQNFYEYMQYPNGEYGDRFTEIEDLTLIENCIKASIQFYGYGR